MKKLTILLNHNVSGTLFRIGSLLLLALVISSNLYAQRGNLEWVPDNDGDGEWIGGNNKVYTMGNRVGIGTSTPLDLLHIWGDGGTHRFARITAGGGYLYSQVAAGIKLERKIIGGNSLTWDIVNQGSFKIRRNNNTLFLMEEDEAQFGTLSDPIPLHIWGNELAKINGKAARASLIIGNYSILEKKSKYMRIDANNIDADQDLHINIISDKDIDLVRGGGNLGIATGATSSAKVDIKSEIMHLRMHNTSPKGAAQWYMGVSDENWTVGRGKLVFSKTQNSDDATMVMTEQGRVGIGMTTPSSTLHVNGTTKTTTLEITGGADLAEPFEVNSESTIQAGMVVAIDPANAGQLKIATSAYDKTVAGIVSGAGNIQPGMVMGQDGSIASGEHPVALTGRVYAKVDARYGAIQPGDLLTTSDTPGHAMKVSDNGQAQGAIIGKAMTALEEGQGLVLVLVSLQ